MDTTFSVGLEELLFATPADRKAPMGMEGWGRVIGGRPLGLVAGLFLMEESGFQLWGGGGGQGSFDRTVDQLL